MRKNITNKQLYKTKDGSVTGTYIKYLFNAVFRHPVCYVMPIVYLLYLIVIFLVVPKILNNNPLFIWNLTSFNIPIFNLFFIAALCSALAVTIYRTSKDDGTELSICAKPLTKWAMVLSKTLVYITLLLVVCVLSQIVVALILPIYGQYSTTNIHGISLGNYKAIMLSMLIGNLINMLFFASISILISMVGGQAITMVCSIGLAVLFALLNFVYSYIVSKPSDVISDDYGSNIKCYSTNTRKQYLEGKEDTANVNYATIECHINEDWQERKHFDTYDYWLQAESKAGNKVTSYIDFGKQLSNLYNRFGLENATKADAAKLTIGNDNSYKYTIDKSSHITDSGNIDTGNLPISIFFWNENQGKYYPSVAVLGGDISSSDWYIQSTLYGLDFGAATRLSSNQWGYRYPGKKVAKALNNKLTYNLNKLFLTSEQQTEVSAIFTAYVNTTSFNSDYLNNTLNTSSSGLWTGNYKDLNVEDKFNVTSKILTNFFVLGQEKEYELLRDHANHEFPYSTEEVVYAYQNNPTFRHAVYMISCAIFYGFNVGTTESTPLYCNCNTGDMSYCESFHNMYSYTISSLYSTSWLSGIWGSISLLLFAAASLISRKSDIK